MDRVRVLLEEMVGLTLLLRVGLELVLVEAVRQILAVRHSVEEEEAESVPLWEELDVTVGERVALGQGEAEAEGLTTCRRRRPGVPPVS